MGTKNTPRLFRPFRLSCLAAAVAGLFGPAYAQDPLAERRPAIDAASAVGSDFRAGVAVVGDDNRRFGQYNGMRDAGLYPLLDANLVTLDRETGTWTKLYGRNLGLDTREVMLDLQRQGQWRYFLGFSQGVRYEPYVVNTGLAGIGTTSQTVNGTTTRPVDLKMSRDQYAIGFDQSLGGSNTFRLRYTYEEKQGERLFGRGATGTAANPTAIEFLTEPIDRTTQTLEATFGHAGKTFQVSGGYYGTLFINHADRIDVQSSLSNAPNSSITSASGTVPVFNPISQPLSNDSHQLFVTGGYNVTPLTRAGFKASYTVARQNEDFIDVTHQTPPPAGAPTSLDGRVDTTLGYFDLTSVEIDRLDLQANVRYEDRNDRTPRVQYVNSFAPQAIYGGMDGFNQPRSWRSLKSLLEAGYRLPAGFKVVGGVDHDQQKRNVPENFRRVNYRAEIDETTGRVEVKRMLAESLSGSLAYSRAKRTGSEYVPETYVANTVSVDVAPLLWADRERSAWRTSFDWTPFEDLSLHVAYDRSDDRYSGKELGPREGERSFYSLDASYALSFRWQANLWLSRDDTRAEQATQTGATAAKQQWQARLRHLGEAVGGGLRGKLRQGAEVGIDVAHHRERAEQRMSALTAFAVTSLPDYEYKLTEVKLFGTQALDADSGVRLDYAYQDWRTNDWTWTGWTYADGTTVTQDARQRVHYVGASYYLRWR